MAAVTVDKPTAEVSPAISATGRMQIVLAEATRIAEGGVFRELPAGFVVFTAQSSVSRKNIEKLLDGKLLRVT